MPDVASHKGGFSDQGDDRYLSIPDLDRPPGALLTGNDRPRRLGCSKVEG